MRRLAAYFRRLWYGSTGLCLAHPPDVNEWLKRKAFSQIEESNR